jgi:hypothetical protein
MRIALLLLLVGCAASRTSSPERAADAKSPVGALNARRRLIDLTPSERAVICDWTASMVGGYGRSYACSDGIHQTFPSQEACVESRSRVPPSCEATVGDSQACTLAAHGDVCASIPERTPECGGRLAGCKTSPPVQHPLPPAPVLGLANSPLQRAVATVALRAPSRARR